MADRKWDIPAVALLMLVLAVVSTWPLVQYFDTGIPYAPFSSGKAWNRSGDQVQLLYWFWLVKENFLGAVPFDTNPFEFNMGGIHESTGLNTIPLAFLYMLFSPLGDVAAYNCVIFSSYVLAGLFMYLLVREYTGSRTGALLAAVIFTFAPARIRGFTAGHGYGLLFFCYPFILYYLELGIRRAKIIYGILAGAGLLGLAMLEPHLIYYLSVFLALYIPLRVLLLLPLPSSDGKLRAASLRLPSWPAPLSVLLVWAAGAAVVLYSQYLFHYRDMLPFPNRFFWWVMGLYPPLLVLVALCCSVVTQRLIALDFRRSMALEAFTFLPLFMLLPLAWWLSGGGEIATGTVVAATLCALLAARILLMGRSVPLMLKILWQGLVAVRERVYPVLPLIFSMAAVVVWIVASKVEKISSTIAGGGRTLADVSLFSATLADLGVSSSAVYVGVIPGVLGGMTLLTIFFRALSGREKNRFVTEPEFLRLLYATVGFCALLLALGLAFGTSSLYALFYHYFPFFNYPRVSDRIITLALFALAILAGYTVRSLRQRCGGRLSRRALTLIVSAAVVFQLGDYNVFKPMAVNILDRGQDVYTYVREHIGDGLLLEIPLWPGDSHQSSLYQHYIMQDRIPRVNGCSPLVQRDYIDKVFTPLNNINQGRLGPEQYALLKRMGVRFITVHDNRDVFPAKVSPYTPLTTVRRLMNSPYLSPVELNNRMHFKFFDKPNHHLYLFRVREENEVVTGGEPAWYDAPYLYDINRRLRHQTGDIVQEKKTGKWIFQAHAGTNGPGFLVYGPYDTYPPGEYRCYFSVEAIGSPKERLARVEVSRVQNGESTPLVDQEVMGREQGNGYRKYALDFSLTTPTMLEFRVFYYGKGTVRVKKIVVHEAGNDTPLYGLEAESMPGDTGRLVFVDGASNGKVIEAVAGRDKGGDMVFGPYRLYTKGCYKIRFVLRRVGNRQVSPKTALAELLVTDDRNGQLYGKDVVHAAELTTTRFTTRCLYIELPADDELSFHVRFTGAGGVQVDRIEILPETVQNTP